MMAGKRFDVVGLGQCSFDILGHCGQFPGVDQKTELDQLTHQGGGPVATALVALSRLGAGVAFCGRTGDDEYGDRIRQGLQAEGVDCTSLLVGQNATSQVAFIAVEETGCRNIFWHRGTAEPLSRDELDPDLIGSCRILHLDGLQHEASLAAAHLAREQGVVTVLDGGSVRDGTLELLPWIDHPVVSEKFSEQLLPGGSVQQKLERLLSFGAVAATVTLGAQGSWSCQREGKPFHQPAFTVDTVDTTGCGDVFHGAYIYGLLNGWELVRIARFSAAAAALKSRQLGGRSAIPNLNELMLYLNVNKS
ncbi:MAG: carbohydrate kinase [Desulfuromonas sp.]|nr:MAG: carbohydrate kinase [Desulfuromonas sp.]